MTMTTEEILTRAGVTREELGQKAYEVHVRMLGIDRSQGSKTWDELPERRRNSFRAVGGELFCRGWEARMP